MPVRTACLDPSCPGYAVPGGKGRCARHRLTTSQRGYGGRWQARPRGTACQMCGATTGLELDHVVPRSLGGTDAPPNLRTLCRSCHARHGMQRGRGGGSRSRYRSGPSLTPVPFREG
jgi:5-methylcytosine-specific restriction endonuclease McrA